MSKIHLSYCVLIGVLVALLYLSLSKDRKVEVVEKHVTDTLVIYKIDTIVEYKPKYITRIATDTLYLPSDSNKQYPLLFEQKHYQNNGLYDAWVSGYNAKLDSIMTYPQIKETTITNTVTKEIERKGLNIYPYIGINNFNHRLNPVMGIATEINKNTIFIGEMGHINDRLYYGVRIGFKIN